MLPSPSYGHLQSILAARFQRPVASTDPNTWHLIVSFEQLREPSRLDFKQVWMVGMLFVPEGAALMTQQIAPRLKEFHHRSGDHIDFFWAGCVGSA